MYIHSDVHTFKFCSNQNSNTPYMEVEKAKKILFDTLRYENPRDPEVCCVLDGPGGNIYHLAPTKETIALLKKVAAGETILK